MKENGRFGEDVKAYGFEDMGFACRMCMKALCMLHNPDDVPYDDDFTLFQDACRRAKVVATASELFEATEGGIAVARLEAQLKPRRARQMNRPLVDPWPSRRR